MEIDLDDEVPPHFFFIDEVQERFLATCHRQGSTSFRDKYTRYRWPRWKHRQLLRELNRKDWPILVPMRDPDDRMWSAWHNPQVRMSIGGDNYRDFLQNGQNSGDLHVMPVTDIFKLWIPDHFDQITWVSWKWWCENVLVDTHKHKSGKPEVQPIPKSLRGRYDYDFAIHSNLT